MGCRENILDEVAQLSNKSLATKSKRQFWKKWPKNFLLVMGEIIASRDMESLRE